MCDDGYDDVPPLYVYAQEVALRRPTMPQPPPRRRNPERATSAAWRRPSQRCGASRGGTVWLDLEDHGLCAFVCNSIFARLQKAAAAAMLHYAQPGQ